MVGTFNRLIAAARNAARIAALCALPFATLDAASAQDQSGTVKIINPYPGGLVDVAARALAEQLAVTWKPPVVVEPKPGAN